MSAPTDNAELVERLRAALGFIEGDVRVHELTDDELAHVIRFLGKDSAILSLEAKVAELTVERIAHIATAQAMQAAQARALVAEAERDKLREDAERVIANLMMLVPDAKANAADLWMQDAMKVHRSLYEARATPVTQSQENGND